MTNGCAPLTHNTRDLDQHSSQKVEESEPPTSPGTDPAPPDDDFSNVSVKVLKSAFSNHVQTQPSKESLKEFDEDILYCGPIKSLKQTFCSEANKTFDKRENFDGKERIATGVSIKDLRRSFGDLTNLVDSDEVDQIVFETQSDQNIGARQESEFRSRSPPIHVFRSTGKLNLGWKACSLGDLRGVSDSFQPPSIPSTRNSDMEEAIVETGISVRALRANYCNQAHLKEEPEAPPRKIQPVEPKSSFSKFDQLSKKSSILHVRSSDASKAQKQFNQSTASTPEQTSNCKSCGKQVFQMEQVKAERAVWHKNCFRCKECNKQLTLDIYSSHEGQLYCKPHFRELFKPKAVVEDEKEMRKCCQMKWLTSLIELDYGAHPGISLDIYSSHEGQLYCKPHFRELFKPKAVVEDEKEMPRRRRHEMIIRESQPIELPPGVVRASDKPDLGLEECSSLNVKSRFQVFEKGVDAQDTDLERSPSNVNVKRSPSILSKLARFQAKGMDIGVTDDSLNGIPYEETSSSSEEEEEEEEEGEETGDVVRSSRKHKERPVSFGKMEDMKCRREQQSRTQLLEDIRSRWESGTTHRKEELREERKHEISNIRSRLFMGHQGKMKEMYEQAVQESERSIQKKGVDIAKSENARNLKEKFERGEILPDDDEDGGKEDPGKRAKDEDLSVFEAGISKKSRSLFLELDATAAKTQQAAPLLMSPIKSPAPVREDSRKLFLSRQASEDVVRASDTIEDVQVETDEVSSKFKFFETFKPQEKQKKQFRITPPREGQVKAEVPDQEIYRDPTVVRCEDKQQDEEEVVRSHTTSKMLSLFRQLEENATKEDMPEGPKPLKRFTPPPDYTHESESSEEESETEDEEEEEDEEETINPNLVRASDKIEDEFLKQSQNAARAKVLRAKFERWEEKENKANAALVTEQQQQQNGLDGDHIEQASIDTTKSLRARFESMKSETQQPKEKPRPKVNRFVEVGLDTPAHTPLPPLARYILEDRVQEQTIKRMETYTLNGGKPYCLPHFKQLFIAKGNYDEGFGLDQHKRKWNNVTRNEEDILLNGINDEHIQ
uniref:(California timema) hypothetical protein n=1 Tax=Timema californicum TaxID=61474 RepID=A0A7R9J0M2_TIMCA|nr:unnamed protein product [Timema californicum]